MHEKKESSEPVHTDAEIKLMYSQDQRYVTMKRTSELKVNNVYFFHFLQKKNTSIENPGKLSFTV